MKPIEPPDIHHLSAAVGWLGLGSPAEAKAELTQIRQRWQNHPDVLEARWLVCAEEARWAEGLQVAGTLVQTAPERSSGWLHRAYALRRVPDGSVEKAWAALLPAADRFPKEPIIPYNLSCYACQMRDLKTARLWLRRSLRLGTKEQVKQMALADPDLEPLWEEIRQL
jgi:hypothetical protein